MSSWLFRIRIIRNPIPKLAAPGAVLKKFRVKLLNSSIILIRSRLRLMGSGSNRRSVVGIIAMGWAVLIMFTHRKKGLFKMKRILEIWGWRRASRGMRTRRGSQLPILSRISIRSLLDRLVIIRAFRPTVARSPLIWAVAPRFSKKAIRTIWMPRNRRLWMGNRHR